ncbi:hypothetical protein HU200_061220 [Digitaria exilis]|uniref:Uncharacterized protein n=1 Tax=Digitaria exilis TaxID=1010633 RepID=A0A835A509_9POAL|nr:hypothetical protein HU200_061220 [Digitaria exilis]CAB3456308.1 unnamed protein product [Digitaria exilis]
MALSRAVLLLLVVVFAAAAAMSASAADEPTDAKASITTPVAHTPVGSFEGADGPVADDDATEDKDAAPVGSPIGTTMTEPKPELAPPAPPSSGAIAASVLVGPAAAAVAVAAAGIFVL